MTISQKRNISLFDIYMGFICIFPIATMLIDTGVINKILFALLLVQHILLVLSRPISKSTFVKLIVMLCSYAFVAIVSVYPLRNPNMMIYFPYFFLYTFFVCDEKELVISWLKNNRRFISAITLLWTALVAVSIVLPSSYYMKEGGEMYFGSFVGSIFRLGPTAVFIQVMAIIMQIFHKKKYAILYMIVPMYCYFMGSSRSYLVIGICLAIISWYLFCGKKQVFWLTLIPLVMMLVWIVMISPIGLKIAFTLDDSRYGDFWFRISSSRSVIWAECLLAWQKSPLVNQIFGNGFNYTYQVSGFWGHNDFVEIVCGFGIFGLLQYIMAIHQTHKCGYNGIKIPFYIKAVIFMVWFFNAFFNMHYTYFCAMLCYPFLVFAMGCYFEGKRDEAIAACYQEND